MWGYARGRVYRTSAYKGWLSLADGEWLCAKPPGPTRGIVGAYRLSLKACRDNPRSDLGNLEKAASDWLQRAGIIQNDRLAEKIESEWGLPTPGVLLVVESVP